MGEVLLPPVVRIQFSFLVLESVSVSFFLSFPSILPTILTVPIAAGCPPSPAPPCSPYKSRPLPLICWTIYHQSGSVRVFICPEFLAFHAPPPMLQSLAALTCWPRKRGDVKVKKSQAPASAHLPETFGLIRELLAANLPNCRKLCRSAAGQIPL